MKKILILSLFAVLLAGCRSKDSDEQPAAADINTNAPSRNTNGEVVQKITAETQKKISLVVQPLASAEKMPEVKAYGQVMDPTPLVTLLGDLKTSRANLRTLKTTAERTKALYDKGELVSRKSVEAAGSDLSQSQIKMEATRLQMALDWGSQIAKMGDDELGDWIASLVSGKRVLIRADVPAGDVVKEIPSTARVSTLENKWEKATVVSQVTKVDPKTQGQGFLLTVENPGSTLRPGVAIVALLRLPEEPAKGVLIPDSAVLRAEGKTWVEVQTAPEEFTRREVNLGDSMDGGWFATGLSPGEKVVTEGAQALLSEELKSQLSID